MRPREVLFVLRSACGGDVRALCDGVPPGGGRILQCLAAQAASLSPACKDVLGPIRGAIDPDPRGGQDQPTPPKNPHHTTPSPTETLPISLIRRRVRRFLQ